jgi:hypothetical protein
MGKYASGAHCKSGGKVAEDVVNFNQAKLRHYNHDYFLAGLGSRECLSVACPPGSYTNRMILGATSPDMCTRCVAGTFSVADGCALCNPGFYSSNNASVCSLCSQGTYSAHYGASTCVSCPPFTWSNFSVVRNTSSVCR